MIAALLSDVHGNLEAMIAVLSDIHKATKANQVFFLGDAVGYGANPNEVVHLIAKECRVKIMGNHDYSALGLLDTSDFNPFARMAIDFTTAVLDTKSTSILSHFRLSHRTDHVTLVHATPEEPAAWNYCLTPGNADRQFQFFDEKVCFIGHSHKPAIFRLNNGSGSCEIEGTEIDLEDDCRYIINIGSVGQPRDGDPRACYVLFNAETMQVSFRRVEYDVATAQSKMASANLPEFLISRLADGK